jgi:hypothetical protein
MRNSFGFHGMLLRLGYGGSQRVRILEDIFVQPREGGNRLLFLIFHGLSLLVEQQSGHCNGNCEREAEDYDGQCHMHGGALFRMLASFCSLFQHALVRMVAGRESDCSVVSAV